MDLDVIMLIVYLRKILHFLFFPGETSDNRRSVLWYVSNKTKTDICNSKVWKTLSSRLNYIWQSRRVEVVAAAAVVYLIYCWFRINIHFQLLTTQEKRTQLYQIMSDIFIGSCQWLCCCLCACALFLIPLGTFSSMPLIFNGYWC